MGGRAPLKADAPRLLGKGNHGGEAGRSYRRAYDALAAEFSLSTPLARQLAGRAAVAWVNLTASTRALHVAREEREHGKGRRPSERQIERLCRRQGLDDSSYAAALAQLREFCEAQRKPVTPLDLITQLHARKGAGG